MKLIIALVAATLLGKVAAATPLKPTQIQPDLGAALGFHIYRFEAELAPDEMLVVRERIEDHGKVFESEHAYGGIQTRSTYEIVLIDSGAFHPSLHNTYVLRYPGSNGSLEKKHLIQWGQTREDTIEMVFSDLNSNEPTRKQSWTGSVEKYSEVMKRWPELKAPRPGFGLGSRRFIQPK